MRRALTLILLATILTGCSSTEKELARADDYLAKGQHAAALVMYRNVLPRLDPIQRAQIADVHSKIAECLAASGRAAEAFSELQRALEQNPGSVMAHQRLSELYLASGNAARALQQAQVVLHVRPEDVDALTVSGAAYAQLANQEAALAALSRAMQLDPLRTNVAIALAELHARNGDMEQGRAVLLESSNRQAQNPEPRLALARLEESLGDNEAAERAYRMAVAVADTPETNLRLAQFLQRSSRITEAEQILKKLDGRERASTLEADFKISAGRIMEAVDAYMAVLQNGLTGRTARREPAPANRVIPRLVEAELEMASGLAARSPLQSAEAIARARSHLERHRAELDSATISVLEAEVALAQGDLARARVHAQAAVATSPEDAPPHYVLGLVKFQSGDKVGAQESWLGAIEQDTDFVPAQLAIASLALEMGEPRTAEEFSSAVVLDEPANLRALLLYARALAAQKRYPAAAGVLARAEALDKKRPEPHVAAGEIALDRGRPAEALVRFQQAVLLDPHSPAAIEGITRTYEHGDIDRPMLRQMEQIATNPPASAALMEVVGRLYLKKGWDADAVRALEHAMAIDGERPSAAAALMDAYLRTGRIDAAAETALRRNSGAGNLLAAVRAQQRNDHEAAIRHYEEAVRQGEPTGYAANNLAWLYAERGASLDRALHLARVAAEARPAEAAVVDTLGMVHLKRRDYSEAVTAFRRAVELAEQTNAPGMAQFRAHLAEAYALAGQPQDAAVERAKAGGSQP